ncbi:DUF6177 family protein [Curtobacterium aurantiacum]|uniref:Uncharacterized protein n=1 Tax=Curtobacterium aurantiacum TaxID=3236919 RepID=A0ABS5VAQ5_9MICO|nr:DUF6177 family protein [Curtobacterium flaccumfaciens]MBT1543797.1 hypothetical protein [Curtobacterium flaccumfaciens pv. flaccumfaciens]MBT1586558.1 hypothetical protein [Curtobacterium flaccumfaciens pv. flaccumfaciens]
MNPLRRDTSEDGRPVAKHPLLDSAGDGSIRYETRAGIVRLGRAQADLLATAAGEGARPILVTDGLSVVTEAFRQALLDAGGAWVVRGDDGLRNGLDGGRLDDFTDAVRTGPPISVQDVAVGYLRPWAPTADQLVVSVSVRHRAADETVLGATTELLAMELAGAAPTGWGTHEPAGRAWDRRTLTEAARSRMPDPTRFLAVGSPDAPLAVTITAQRTEHGVEELTTGLLAVGALGDTVSEMRVAAVPQVLGRLATTQLPLFALVLRRPGRADLAQAPRLSPPPLPVAMLLGAPAVRQLDLDVEAMRDRFGAVIAGRPRIPALVLPFGRQQDRNPVDELADVVDHIGRDRVADAVGMDDRTREQVQRAAEQ